MNIPKFDFDFDFTISLPYLESSFSISLPPGIIPPIGNDGGAETAVLEVPPEVEALELKLAVLDFMNTPATELPDAGDEGVKVVADVGTKILRIRLMKQKFLLVFACSPGT
jgi:hypothetical protein